LPKSLSTWLSFGDSHLTVKLYKLHHNILLSYLQNCLVFNLYVQQYINLLFPSPSNPVSLNICSNSIWKKSMIFPFITQFVICGNGWNFYFACVKSCVQCFRGIFNLPFYIHVARLLFLSSACPLMWVWE
jgi:hypothetical protein